LIQMDNKNQNNPGQQQQNQGQKPGQQQQGGSQKPEQQKHDDLVKKIEEDDRQGDQTDGTVGGT
jgi:hypothetical protein